MSNFDSNIIWPPVGWSQFKKVKKSFCQSMAKDSNTGKVFGLQYKIESIPLFKNDKKYLRHDVVIDGWEYSILNESTEYPVLSFTLLDKFDAGLPQECFITDIRSYSTMMPHTKGSAARAVSAAIFLINQIENGHVPDVNRVLNVYKLHPSQSFLYKRDKKAGFDLRQAFDRGIQSASVAKQA